MQLHMTCLLALKTHAQKSLKKKVVFPSPIAIKGCFSALTQRGTQASAHEQDVSLLT